MIRQQLPSEGWGALVHNRYWADIDGSPHRANALRDVFRRKVAEVMPLESVGPVTQFKKTQTFTVTLPLGGALPMRVEEILPARIVCATLEGHPLAGLVTFDFIERGKQVRFEVGVHARLAARADALLMAPVDGLLQAVNWTAVAERMVAVSGGRAPAGVQSISTALDEEEARKIEAWAEALAVRLVKILASTSRFVILLGEIALHLCIRSSDVHCSTPPRPLGASRLDRVIGEWLRAAATQPKRRGGTVK